MRQERAIFLVAATVVFMVALDSTVVIAAFPALRAHFASASAAELSWVLNAYAIVYAALLIPMGQWADRAGRARVFQMGLAMFTVASAGAAFAPDAKLLIVTRILQAIGAAAVTPASLALLLEGRSLEERRKVVSAWTAVGALAVALGPSMGAVVLTLAGWQWIFLINVPVGIWAGWQARRSLPKSVPSLDGGTPDLVGSLLLILAVGALASAIVHIGDHGAVARSTMASVGCGGVLLTTFVLRERSGGRETPWPEVFANPAVRWANGGTFLLGAAMSLMFLSFYLFMTGIWRYSPLQAGLAATAGPLGVIVVITVTSRLLQGRSSWLVLLLGGLMFAIGNLWFVATLSTSSDYLRGWLPGQLMGAIGIGLMLPGFAAAAVTGLPPARLGVGNAVNATLRQLGGAVGAAMGVALVGAMDSGLEDFRRVYLTLCVAGVLLAVIALPIRGRR
jgi:MFS family permease